MYSVLSDSLSGDETTVWGFAAAESDPSAKAYASGVPWAVVSFAPHSERSVQQCVSL
jgi:hypothetical protein